MPLPDYQSLMLPVLKTAAQNVGCRVEETFCLKKVDEDFFE
jgi:restriction endonuclease Mrr